PPCSRHCYPVTLETDPLSLHDALPISLHATEITRRLLTQRRWSSNSKAPQVSVRTTLARDIRVRQASSRFQRTGAGIFALGAWGDRKSTRLNSSHQIISYAVFCLKKKT